jgi:transglutaminase-like putative cysteine protease
MLYQASHITRYLYEEPVAQCLTEAHLIPRNVPGQMLHASRIHVTPEPAVFEQRQDYFGNHIATFAVFRTHDRFVTEATSIVEVQGQPLHDLPSISWEDVHARIAIHEDDDSLDAYEFIFDSPLVPTAEELAEYARPTFTEGRSLVEAVEELSHRIYSEFKYTPKSTSIDMPLMEVLQGRRGVCQDFAHVMIGALRSLGLAARYVSGYLRSGAEFQGAEASHAWVAVFVPGYGWLNLDPTNDVIPSDGHVTLAWGRDYGDVTPVKGIALGGGGQTVEVEVRVRPLEE